jgi:Predicted protease with the C-terminal PDZ domain
MSVQHHMTVFTRVFHVTGAILLCIFVLMASASCGFTESPVQAETDPRLPSPQPTPIHSGTIAPAYPVPEVTPPSHNDITPGPTVYILERPKVLGIVIDKDSLVIHVEPGSSAALIGIEVGDKLKYINGVDVAADRQRAKLALYSSLDQNGRAVITIERQGHVMEFSGELQYASYEYLRREAGKPIPTVTAVLPPDYYL